MAHEHDLIYALYTDARKNESRYANCTLPKLLVFLCNILDQTDFDSSAL